MKSAHCILFVSFNKSQNNTIQDIINYKGKDNNDYFLVTTMKNCSKYIAKENICTLKFDKSILYLMGEIYRRCLLRQINTFLSTHILVYQKIEVLTPHLMNIPSNYIVNKLHKECPHVKISNYPDGIAQLYDAGIEWKMEYDINIYKVLIRYMIGNLIGLNYRLIFGSLLSSYEKLDSVYTYVKDLLPKDLNLDIFQIYPTKKEIIGENIIIICLNTRVSIDRYIELFFERQYPKINQEISQIYYKPHPTDASDPFLTLINKHNYPINIIDKNEVLEESVNKYKCNQVISLGTFSTALLNLRLIYGKEIQLMIFEFEGIKRKNYARFSSIMDYFKIDQYILKQ